ncbi:MAG: bifunctional demethylmenaquinone methyltransferase/2-methoxy-6-polyprenyl-1,4-benzoquinol methylase UbiE [Candidatus Sumerlaeaceae bacterium]|jgi:demethylmenaquinone methyltransferase/2-methoxy-6-polyprenyl-1,4-benzoquinol methylase
MTPGVPPLPEPDELVQRKSARSIRSMFDAISPTYDFLNHLLSAQIDRLWRRTLARTVLAECPPTILDVCTGTGDVIFEIARQAARRGMQPRCVGTDFSYPMLQRAMEKRGKQPELSGQPAFLRADTLELPFGDCAFAAVTVAFGLRNVENLERALVELARVTRPGGQLVVLEFSKPRLPVVRELYHFYFHRILPMVGWLISGTKAYLYLPKSVARFPEGEDFAALMKKVGWCDVSFTSLTGGIATLYSGKRPAS